MHLKCLVLGAQCSRDRFASSQASGPSRAQSQGSGVNQWSARGRIQIQVGLTPTPTSFPHSHTTWACERSPILESGGPRRSPAAPEGAGWPGRCLPRLVLVQQGHWSTGDARVRVLGSNPSVSVLWTCGPGVLFHMLEPQFPLLRVSRQSGPGAQGCREVTK